MDQRRLVSSAGHTWERRERPPDLDAAYFQISGMEDEHVRRMQSFFLTLLLAGSLPREAFGHAGPLQSERDGVFPLREGRSAQAGKGR